MIKNLLFIFISIYSMQIFANVKIVAEMDQDKVYVFKVKNAYVDKSFKDKGSEVEFVLRLTVFTSDFDSQIIDIPKGKEVSNVDEFRVRASKIKSTLVAQGYEQVFMPKIVLQLVERDSFSTDSYIGLDVLDYADLTNATKDKPFSLLIVSELDQSDETSLEIEAYTEEFSKTLKIRHEIFNRNFNIH